MVRAARGRARNYPNIIGATKSRRGQPAGFIFRKGPEMEPPWTRELTVDTRTVSWRTAAADREYAVIGRLLLSDPSARP